MKNNFMKRTLSIVMVIMMAVSTFAVSMISANAASDQITYNLEFETTGSDGQSSDEIMIKVNGTNGSTAWHNVGEVGDSKGTSTASFTDVNVGAIQSVTVKNTGGIHIGVIKRPASDGWYPNYIKVNDTKIYGGRWVDNETEVTMSLADIVYKLTINTGTDTGAGTDSDILIKLYSNNGKVSSQINASEIHSAVNAFENGDSMTMYMHVPDNFDKVKKVEFFLNGSGVYQIAKPWQLKSFEGEKVQGANSPDSFSKEVNVWVAKSYKDSNYYTATI